MASRLLAEAQVAATELTEACLWNTRRHNQRFRPGSGAVAARRAISAILARKTPKRSARGRGFRRGNGGQLRRGGRGSAIAAAYGSPCGRPTLPAKAYAIREEAPRRTGIRPSGKRSHDVRRVRARRRPLPGAANAVGTDEGDRRGSERRGCAAPLTLAEDSAEAFPSLKAPTIDIGFNPRPAATVRSGLQDDGTPVEPCPPRGGSPRRPGVLIRSQPAQTTLPRKGPADSLRCAWKRYSAAVASGVETPRCRTLGITSAAKMRRFFSVSSAGSVPN